MNNIWGKNISNRRTHCEHSHKSSISSEKRPKKIKAHLKIDTGMHRLGVSSSDLDEILNIFKFENLYIEGVFSHLSAPTSNDPREVSIKSRITSVKTVSPGEYIGYGINYLSKEKIKIAIISIGYADGLPRSLSSGNGFVLINGQKAPIIGNICMDRTIIDISNIENVFPGDIAVLIGKSKDLEITACDMAACANTITNEILSRLGDRLVNLEFSSS